MTKVETVEELEAIYGSVSEVARIKVRDHVTPLFKQWIDQSQFCVLSTVGPEGTDGSPRGDDGSVVRIVNPTEIQMPDWRGNNRVDTLRNIVRDGRISLLFLVQGESTCVRVNGVAEVHTDADLLASYEQGGKHPRSVIRIRVGEVYSQCARAIFRSRLWSGEDRSEPLPTLGELVREVAPDFDGAEFDAKWADPSNIALW